MPPVDTLAELGERIREARLAHGLSQGQLADQLAVDRSAVARMESGERKVTALELMRLGQVLHVPVAHFVHRSPDAMTSRRMDLEEDAQSGERTRFQLDAQLEAHFRDAEFLRSEGYLPVRSDLPTAAVDSEGGARRLASQVRAFVGHAEGPLPSLSLICELAGLHLLVVDIDGDGSSLTPQPGFGVSVIGGLAPSGRKRFTAAHELGHHVLGDECQSDAGVAASRDERESRIDAFASELLLPTAELARRWESLAGDAWDRLVRVAADYRVSWAVAVRTALSAQLIDEDEAGGLHSRTPQLGDFLVVVGEGPEEDLQVWMTGPGWRQAVLRAYVDAKITKARASEMLHGALPEDQFPIPAVEPAP